LAQGFKDRDDHIPNIVAAVDCVVLEMRAPTRTKFDDAKQTNVSSNFNRKGFFATTVLAFVDSKMRFLSVSITCGSSSHDSSLFNCSRVGHVLSLSKAEGGIDPKWVVAGDDAFKTLPHVMTPFQKKALTHQQRNFNYCLSKQRCVVETAFGLWKGKWGIFWRPLLVQQRNIKKLVEVTARLHNLCINRHVSEDLNDFIVADDFFWQRTCSEQVRQKYQRSGRPLPPQPSARQEVDFADATSVRAMTQSATNSTTTMQRLRRDAMNAIEARGTIRRIARLPPACLRVSADLDDDTEVVAVGDFNNDA